MKKWFIQPWEYWPANDYGLVGLQVSKSSEIKYRNEGWLLNDWAFEKMCKVKELDGTYEWYMKVAVI